MDDFLGSGLSCFLLLGHILGFLHQSSVGGEINISGRNGRKWSCRTICYPNFWRNLFSLQLWNVVELADALRRHDWVLQLLNISIEIWSAWVIFDIIVIHEMHLFLLYDVIGWLGMGYLSPWHFLWASTNWRILRIKRYVVGPAVWWVRPVWVQRSAVGVSLGLGRCIVYRWSWALSRPISISKVWRYWPPGRRWLPWWSPRRCLFWRKLLLILRSVLRDFLVWFDALLWLLVDLGGIKGFA